MTNEFTGRWLSQGERHGTDFTHSSSEYEHDGEYSPMRHAYVEQEGTRVGVWVPASWSDEEARAALESNW